MKARPRFRLRYGYFSTMIGVVVLGSFFVERMAMGAKREGARSLVGGL